MNHLSVVPVFRGRPEDKALSTIQPSPLVHLRDGLTEVAHHFPAHGVAEGGIVEDEFRESVLEYGKVDGPAPDRADLPLYVVDGRDEAGGERVDATRRTCPTWTGGEEEGSAAMHCELELRAN
jgi:hypothetical protein